MSDRFAQAGVAACLACAIDALNRAQEIAMKVKADKLAYDIDRAKDNISGMMPLVEEI